MMRVLNVVNVPHGQVPSLLPHILSMQEQMHSRDFAFLLTAEPEQEPYLQKLDRPLETFRLLRQELNAHGVAAGILAQTTLGHDERGHPRSPAPFQRMVGTDGNVCQPVFCPLDAGFQRHLASAMTMIARAQPAFILIDDDFRLVHREVSQGCFCPLHFDLLAELHGVRLSRQQLLGQVALDSPEGAQLRGHWEDVERESLLRLARTIRRSVNDVDKEIAAGFCGTQWSRLMNEDIARTLAGPHRPLVRIAGAVYNEGDSKDFPERIDHVVRQRRHLAPDVEVLAESDTYPHTHYSVSEKKLSALLTTSVIIGLDGAKAWVTPMSWQGGENPRFIRAYSRLAPIADALEPLIREIRWTGAATPIKDDETFRLPWTATEGKNFLQPAWTRVFGRLAVPHVPGGHHRPVRAFSGESVSAYSAEDWTEFFSAGVLLDGGAARRLSDMGFAHHMGVNAEIDPQLYISAEKYRDLPSWNGPSAGVSVGALRSRIDGLVRLDPISADTEIIGDYVTQPWRDSDQCASVSPSVTVYRNELGGRVAVYAADLTAVPLLQHLINPTRRVQLLTVLAWLCPAEYPVRLDADTDLYLQVGRLASGNELLVYALNLQPDPIPQVVITADAPMRSIERLDDRGTWVSAQGSGAPARSRELTLNLDYLDYAVLRIKTE